MKWFDTEMLDSTPFAHPSNGIGRFEARHIKGLAVGDSGGVLEHVGHVCGEAKGLHK